MDEKRFLILGGYGSTGYPLADLLLKETNACLLLGGRTLSKAIFSADLLNQKYGMGRVEAVFADASDTDSLRPVFKGVDMVIVASSTAKYTENVVRAALEANIDYFDLQYSSEKLKALERLAGEIQNSGRTFITEGGFHPGLPAAMVRFAAGRFDKIRSANVGSVIQIDWASLDLSDSTLEEFVGEFLDFKTLHFKNRTWVNKGLLAMMIPKYMKFEAPFGRRYTIPMFLEEMRQLPENYPSLEETGFFVGGFNWFVDWFLSPLIPLFMRINPERGLIFGSKMIRWGLDRFSKPPFGTVLKLEAVGEKDGKPKKLDLTISHEDGYMLTAIPAAACLIQYIEGAISRPGISYQAHVVKPIRFMDELRRLGAKVELNEY